MRVDSNCSVSNEELASCCARDNSFLFWFLNGCAFATILYWNNWLWSGVMCEAIDPDQTRHAHSKSPYSNTYFSIDRNLDRCRRHAQDPAAVADTSKDGGNRYMDASRTTQSPSRVRSSGSASLPSKGSKLHPRTEQTVQKCGSLSLIVHGPLAQAFVASISPSGMGLPRLADCKSGHASCPGGTRNEAFSSFSIRR
jgi:hypothetical protein